MPAPVLLLDVMDTLVHDPFLVEIPAFFSMTLAQLLEVKDRHAWIRFERGEIDEAALAAEYFADRRPVDLEGLKGAMRGGYRWLEGIEALLADLKSAGLQMHALSNYPTWWEIVEERLQLSRYLEWSFVSCKTGRRKPEPEAFLEAARALGVEPAACVFVDDRPENCRAAQAVGMDAIQFESASRLDAAIRPRLDRASRPRP